MCKRGFKKIFQIIFEAGIAWVCEHYGFVIRGSPIMSDIGRFAWLHVLLFVSMLCIYMTLCVICFSSSLNIHVSKLLKIV